MNQALAVFIFAVIAVALYFLYAIGLYGMIYLDRIFYISSFSPMMAYTVMGAIIGLVVGIVLVLKNNMKKTSVLVAVFLVGCLAIFGKINWDKTTQVAVSNSGEKSAKNKIITATVVAKSANLRSEPNPNAHIKARLSKGATVIVLKIDNYWVKCRLSNEKNATEGWIYKNLLILQ